MAAAVGSSVAEELEWSVVAVGQETLANPISFAALGRRSQPANLFLA